MNTNKNPSLSIYHPNPKRTGCAVKMTLSPATPEEDGHIDVKIARQMTVGDRTALVQTLPMFDWENTIEVKLSFDDICQMLQVFRGECENINDGKGLFHVNANRSQTIYLSHVIDPVIGYYLVVNQKKSDEEFEDTRKILLSCHESLGICEAFASSLGRICFGD